LRAAIFHRSTSGKFVNTTLYVLLYSLLLLILSLKMNFIPYLYLYSVFRINLIDFLANFGLEAIFLNFGLEKFTLVT
jgi:uncharacterized membrane protein